jgi:hypothetical protein
MDQGRNNQGEGKNTLANLVSRFLFLLAKPELAIWRVVISAPLYTVTSIIIVKGLLECYVLVCNVGCVMIINKV